MNKNNILIIASLLIMLFFCGIAYSLFSKVEKEKSENERLTKALQQKEIMIKNLLDSNKLFLSQSIETNRQLSEYITKNNSSISTNDTLKKILEKSETVAVDALKLNDLPKYQQASQLEKEGFTALANNQFDLALSKFNQVEKIYPSFHMSYEISRLLKKETANFNSPETQKNIKEQVIKNFSWKAPQDQIIILKRQVKQ